MTSDHFPIEACINFDYSTSIDELNEEITQKLISAAHKSIPYQTNRIFKTSLPPNIVRSGLIPTLISNNNEIRTDEEKATFFGESLQKTFSPNNDLINPQKD
ncbi:hypothetical protein BpHYR1_015680 [Brachionus plicatilis]|uniref:RNA-directed DNA polymerase from mobile element jockey-like n=1 Tax=Brachionus plicatilis TaxID=10195 RepID=A0A3M7R7A9_BRAPC|nr:hypothetical protein BpHYR1_015680 [Brachionus plicatilis]